ncbi:MAG TPA: hypothetical protein VFP32_00720 [Candidatus Saccharimonadales bacterium]|nr:hypothetical protein [Candidatus Saccharimonadales bacterium]
MAAPEEVASYPEALEAMDIDIKDVKGAVVGSLRVSTNGNPSLAELECLWLSLEAIEDGTITAELQELSAHVMEAGGFESVVTMAQKYSPTETVFQGAGFRPTVIDNETGMVTYEKFAHNGHALPPVKINPGEWAPESIATDDPINT